MSRTGWNEFVQRSRGAAARKMAWLSGKSALCLFPRPGRPRSKNTATARGDVRQPLKRFFSPTPLILYCCGYKRGEKNRKAQNRIISSNGILTASPCRAARIHHPTRNLMTVIEFSLCVRGGHSAKWACTRVCLCARAADGEQKVRKRREARRSRPEQSKDASFL